MASGDIKQKIILEGEDAYRKALQDANRNLKTLKSALKAETAELGANATAQQKNEVKLKSLRKQIAEQEKIVKTYRDALEEVRAKYGDNEDAIAKWEQKLNNARTTLANMKNQIDATGNSYKNIESGAKSAAVENAALALSFEKISEAAGTMSSKIEGIFKGVASSISAVVGTIWSDLMEIAAKADDWTDMADFFGSSTTNVQRWARALGDIGTDMSTITTLVSQLKYGGKADKVTEWFGISDENYSDDLQYLYAVLEAMQTYRSEMESNGTWESAMSDIFGARRVKTITDILGDWERFQKGMATYDVENGGIGVSAEDLQTMDELNYQVESLKGKWKAFKDQVETQLFGKIALDITSNFQNALDALIAFMDADTQEEKDAAIEKFKDNLVEAFTKIGEAVNAAGEALEEVGKGLQGSENGYVKLLGDLLSTVGSVLQWLADPNNVALVEGAFTALFAVWATSKALEFVSTLKSVSGYITNIFTNRKAPNIDFGNSGNGTGTGNGTGVGTQTITSQSVTSQSVTTGSTATENVTTMYVANMIGGNNGLPNTNPSSPGTDTGGIPNGSDIPSLSPGNGTGLNGYVPVLIPGTGSGSGLSLPGVDTVNLNGGSPTLNLPAGNGGDGIQLNPGEWSIDGSGGDGGSGTGAGIAALLTSTVAKLIGGVAVFGVTLLTPADTADNSFFDKNGDPTGEFFGNEDMVTERARTLLNMYGSLPEGFENDADLLKLLFHQYLDLDTLEKLESEYGLTPQNGFTMDQYKAIEGYWDYLREYSNGGWADGWDNTAINHLIEVFDEDWETLGPIFDSISEWQKISPNKENLPGLTEYVPADWWTNQNTLTSDDISGFRGLPGLMTAAVQKGVSGIQVNLDGYKVGTLVTPYVSQQIARDTA